MKSLRQRSAMPRKKEEMKRSLPKLELLTSKNSKRRKLHKSLKPKRWNKSSLPLRPFRRPKLPPLKRLPPKLISQD